MVSFVCCVVLCCGILCVVLCSVVLCCVVVSLLRCVVVSFVCCVVLVMPCMFRNLLVVVLYCVVEASCCGAKKMKMEAACAILWKIEANWHFTGNRAFNNSHLL